MSTIEELIQEQKSIRERVLLKEAGVKFHKFNGVVFYDGMSFFDQSEAQLVLAHAYLHKCYGMKNFDLDKKVIEKLHKKSYDELVRRKLYHSVFDKLDATLT